ncbi:hypothetical protein EVAR_48853_1 [Eumeta japonica]|uniref:CHK kinase-like domain-containing protein n=1 Tax=Eumeta variegata TaxID=151549 RepID=A0A4C1YDZ7_EUMVA|nr:hypothetical protein EVAR_48853_1 [Eumeta japonica]
MVTTPELQVSMNAYSLVAYSKVRVEEVGKKGDNYMALVRRLIVQQSEKPFHMVVKIAPTEQMARMMMQIVQMFNNEALIAFSFLLRCTHMEAPYECIALEDLNQHGFAIADRFKSLTRDEVKLIVSDLAKFHALGFVLRERDNALFEELKKGLQNMWGYYDNNKEFKAYMHFVQTQVESVLDSDDDKRRIENVMQSFTSEAKHLHKSDLSSKHTVVIQGDCWTNNFLFRTEDGKPVEAVMLDYQLARISSPVVDLQYMIFNCTDSETRKGNYSEWLDHYYDSLGKQLNLYDLEVHDVYPREKFDDDLHGYAKNSLALAFILASVLVREVEEVIDYKEGGMDLADMEKDLENMSVSNMKATTAKRFKDRVHGIVKDFIEYGYI